MLSKVLTYIFSVTAMLSLFMAPLKYTFWNQSINASVQDKQVQQELDVAGLPTYQNQIAIEPLNYSDGPLQYSFGLPTGQELEVDWLYYGDEYSGYDAIYFRHLVGKTLYWWTDWHNLDIYFQNGTENWDKINKEALVSAFDSAKGSSIFTASCDHIVSSAVIKPYSNLSISQSWDTGKLYVYMGYNVSWNSAELSIWGILSMMVGFIAPDFGIPGLFGTIINAMVAIPIWVGTAFVAYKIIMAFFPFSSAASGD